MRPGIGLDNNAAESSRPRKSSNAESPSSSGDRERYSSPATTFFLARDSDVPGRPLQSERSSTSSLSSSPLSSLQDTIQESDRPFKHAAPRSVETPGRSGSRRRSTIKPGTAERLLRRGSSSGSVNPEPSAQPPPLPFEIERARDITPSPLPSRDVSLPSSPKSQASRRSLPKSTLSDDELLTSADETGSQTVLSSGEEDDIEAGASQDARRPEMLRSIGEGVQDSQPELIMPSIKMPSRRPFTERGKRLGRLKIMVAGRKGMAEHTNYRLRGIY